MKKHNRLVTGSAVLLLAPIQQASTGFLGIDWWVWILIGVILLLILLIIGYVLQEKPGPPIPQRESKMYVTAASVGKAPAEAQPQKEVQPEPEPQPISEPVTEAEPEMEIPLDPEPQPDDLGRLEGVGPKVVSLLNAAGITTFAALAATDVERLNQILDEADLQFMDPGSWPEQAALAAKGDWEGFEKLTAELKGGRRES